MDNDNKVKALEARVRELERALDYEKKHNTEAQRQISKRDRRIKEILIETDGYKEKIRQIQGYAGDLENQIKIHKRKLEEAQELCNENAHRYRQSNQRYQEQTAKIEEFEDQMRRKRATAQGTGLFIQM